MKRTFWLDFFFVLFRSIREKKNNTFFTGIIGISLNHMMASPHYKRAACFLEREGPVLLFFYQNKKCFLCKRKALSTLAELFNGLKSCQHSRLYDSASMRKRLDPSVVKNGGVRVIRGRTSVPRLMSSVQVRHSFEQHVYSLTENL